MMAWVTPAAAVASLIMTSMVIVIHWRTIRATGAGAEKKKLHKEANERIGSNAQRLTKLEGEVRRLRGIDIVGFKTLVDILNNLCMCEQNQNTESMREIAKRVNDFLIENLEK